MKQIRLFHLLNKAILISLLIFGASMLPITSAQSQSSPDFSPYRMVLARFVDDNGMVDYAGLKANSTNLDQFLDYLANLPPDSEPLWSGPDRIAFWINTYNAFTLKAIIDHYPIQSSFRLGLSAQQHPANFGCMGQTRLPGRGTRADPGSY